jgi:hypothetical protein
MWDPKEKESFDFLYTRSLRKMADILFDDRGNLDDLELLLLEYIQRRILNLNLV